MFDQPIFRISSGGLYPSENNAYLFNQIEYFSKYVPASDVRGHTLFVNEHSDKKVKDIEMCKYHLIDNFDNVKAICIHDRNHYYTYVYCDITNSWLRIDKDYQDFKSIDISEVQKSINDKHIKAYVYNIT